MIERREKDNGEIARLEKLGRIIMERVIHIREYLGSLGLLMSAG